VAVCAAALLSGAAVLLAASTRSAESFTASYQVKGFAMERMAILWNHMVMPENTSGRSSWWLQRPNL
jgi:hypothetical protein